MKMIKCQRCGFDEEHHALGYCRKCYAYVRYRNIPEVRQKSIKSSTRYGVRKYREDEIYREKRKEQAKKFYRDKKTKKPGYNAERLRNHRKKFPDRYNYTMARTYIKRLNEEQRKKLFAEFNGVVV